MKKQLLRTMARKLLVVSIMVAAIIVKQNVYAGEGNVGVVDSVAMTNENQVSVKYIGSTDASALFDVKCKNPKGTEIYLQIVDASGEVLYNQKINEKTFNKRFSLSKDMELDNLSFHIVNKKGIVLQSFDVNVVAHTVEDVFVSRN